MKIVTAEEFNTLEKALNADQLWNALKEECCADPSGATRIVMLSKANLEAALQKALEVAP